MSPPVKTVRAPSDALRRAPTGSWQRWLKPAVGLAITVALVVVIAGRVDSARVMAAIRAVPPPSLVLASALLAGAYACKIARWHVMLTSVAPGVPRRIAAQTLLASVALNNVLPFRAGDVARVFAFRDQIGASASALIPLLVLERILDAAMLVMMAALVTIPIDSAGILPPALKGIGFLGAAAGLAGP